MAGHAEARTGPGRHAGHGSHRRSGRGAGTAGGEEHPSRAFAAKRGIKDRADDIEFRLLAADRPDLAADYTLLRRILWHKQAGRVELLFMDGLKVTIHGTNLLDLKERIRLRRVTWVQEQGADPVRMRKAQHDLGKGFLWVEKIDVEEAGEGE
jgi:hypothetical protein